MSASSLVLSDNANCELDRLSNPSGKHFELGGICCRGQEGFDHGLTTGAGVEVSALGLEDAPFDAFEIHLRPALFHLRGGEFLKFDLCLRGAFD